MTRLLLLSTLLVVPACLATSPVPDDPPRSVSQAERAAATQVAFHVTGMKKTKSGAT
jgi:hypothetical protein